MARAPIQPNTPVRVEDPKDGRVLGYARVDHYIQPVGRLWWLDRFGKNLILLDRRIGLYYTYELDWLWLCNASEVANLVQYDTKLEHGDVLHVILNRS